MSFLRDCKDKPFESKGRMYFEGLKQRADNLKKYAWDEEEKPVNLSYNLYKTLLRLKELREVFYNHKITEPKNFQKDVDENDIRDAIRDKFLTIQEVSDEIEALENLVIQIMEKTLVHLLILPVMQETEFAKSDNDEYITDIYSSTLNLSVLENCEKYISILSDSKEKSKLLLSIENLKNKLLIPKSEKLTEEVELSDDDLSEEEVGIKDSYEWLDDDRKINITNKKKVDPIYSPILNHQSSIDLDDSLRWSQFPFEKSQIIPVIPEEKKHQEIIQPSNTVAHPYTIWYKLGVLLLSTILGAVAGLVVSVFFTAGFALPVAVSVGAVFGFLLGLKMLHSKENDRKNGFTRFKFSSNDTGNNISSKPLEVSHAI